MQTQVAVEKEAACSHVVSTHTAQTVSDVMKKESVKRKCCRGCSRLAVLVHSCSYSSPHTMYTTIIKSYIREYGRGSVNACASSIWSPACLVA